jgi:hypothetical protein
MQAPGVGIHINIILDTERNVYYLVRMNGVWPEQIV